MGIDTMKELDYLTLVLCVDCVRTGSLQENNTAFTVRAPMEPIIYPVTAPKVGVNGQTYYPNVNWRLVKSYNYNGPAKDVPNQVLWGLHLSTCLAQCRRRGRRELFLVHFLGFKRGRCKVMHRSCCGYEIRTIVLRRGVSTSIL